MGMASHLSLCLSLHLSHVCYCSLINLFISTSLMLGMIFVEARR